VAHPSMVGNGEEEVFPIHGFEITENSIDNTESCFQIRVTFVMPTNDRMPARNGPEHGLVGFITDTLSLDGEVEQCLGAEVSLVPEFLDDNGTS